MAAAKKNADVFAFPGFDFAKMNESYRQFAEKGMVNGSEAYEQFKTAAEDMTTSAQKSFDAMREGVSALMKQSIENAKANTDAGVAFVEKLSTAKTFSEVVELQSAYFRSAFEQMVGQAREAQEMSMKTAEKVAAPAKAVAEKAAEQVKTVVATAQKTAA
jgi:phasin